MSNQDVQEGYEIRTPSDELAILLFAGLWSSLVPGFEQHTGSAALFQDPRMQWFIDRLGDCVGKSVLDLGPLEGGHSFMFAKAGASVLAIEANRNAFLRCLVVKEALQLHDCRFMLGNFEGFLESTIERFDVINCCGVLYHLTDPLLTLARIASLTDNICIWSMFYDDQAISALPVGSPGRQAFLGSSSIREYGPHKLRYYHRSYHGTCHGPQFSGGSADGSVWLKRNEVVNFLRHEGFEIEISFEAIGDLGPSAAIFASRSKANHG